MIVSYEQALSIIQHKINSASPGAAMESVPLDQARGRVLAEEVAADRDLPPFHRVIRDGYALRSADLTSMPVVLQCLGEVPAGRFFDGEVKSGQCVSIMTGAPLPAGADAVVMVEHTRRSGDDIEVQRQLRPWENVVLRGSEAAKGASVLPRGRRLQAAEIGLLATVGKANVEVYREPRVAILPTGDEIVEVDETPGAAQIRNSNASSLAAQVRRAGGDPVMLAVARDNFESTSAQVAQGLDADVLLLSGGVSAGKYDIVERVLADAGAECFFDRVRIQPGQPVVFGSAWKNGVRKYIFGLPGNPVSTMVTFEVFARAAIERLQGVADPPLPLLRARLSRDVRHKPGLTRFLPALLSADGATVEPVASKGSGDVASLGRANAFLVFEPERESWAAGEDMRVLLK